METDCSIPRCDGMLYACVKLFVSLPNLTNVWSRLVSGLETRSPHLCLSNLTATSNEIHKCKSKHRMANHIGSQY